MTTIENSEFPKNLEGKGNLYTEFYNFQFGENDYIVNTIGSGNEELYLILDKNLHNVPTNTLKEKIKVEFIRLRGSLKCERIVFPN